MVTAPSAERLPAAVPGLLKTAVYVGEVPQYSIAITATLGGRAEKSTLR